VDSHFLNELERFTEDRVVGMSLDNSHEQQGQEGNKVKASAYVARLGEEVAKEQRVAGNALDRHDEQIRHSVAAARFLTAFGHELQDQLSSNGSRSPP